MTIPALQKFAAGLPATPTRTVRGLAAASLISQIGIVVTGGAVRLTASGLGCPEWPKCTPESLVTTEAMGYHGIIEFGNRMLTFVLVIIAAAMIVSLWKMRRNRRDLWWLSIGLLAGIPAQAVVGGITVLTHLNPWVVGLHFLVSMTLVVMATVLVDRVRLPAAQARTTVARSTPATLLQLLVVIAVAAAAAVVLGVVVTGSGPHAGDHGAARNNLDPDLMTRLHAAPVYLLVIATVAAVVLAYRRGAAPRLRRALSLLLATVLAQGVIGYTQHFLHLPIALVLLHMLGASVLTAATAHAVYTGYTRNPLSGTEAAAGPAGN